MLGQSKAVTELGGGREGTCTGPCCCPCYLPAGSSSASGTVLQISSYCHQGGSQLKVSQCFTRTCNSLRGQNVSTILASLFCLVPRLRMSRTEVGLRVTLGKREGTNLLLNFPHKLVLQEKIQEFRWCYEIFLLTYHSAYTINRKLLGSLKFDFCHWTWKTERTFPNMIMLY